MGPSRPTGASFLSSEMTRKPNENTYAITAISWAFVALIFYAPFAWGCTTSETRAILDFTLLGICVLYVTHLASRRKFPPFPRLALLLLVGLNVFGWIMALNAKYRHDSESWIFTESGASVSFLPGSVDGSTSIDQMWHVSAMSAAFLILCDLVRAKDFRWLLLKALAVSGFAVALTGLYLKATQSDSMLWTTDTYEKNTFFAAFRYHGHAAAFLNLCWPAALVVLLRSMEKDGNDLERAFWVNAFFFTFASLYANTSQAGHVLGIVGLVISGILLRKQFERQLAARWPLWGSGAILLGLAASLTLLGLGNSFQDWAGFFEDGGSANGRLIAYGACMDMISESPLGGFGPGTFSLGFPYYTTDLGDRIAGFWDHAHQDYLQTTIEWGIPAALGWFAVFGIGMVKGFRIRGGKDTSGWAKDIAVDGSLIALGLLALHALIDFPLQIASIQLPAILYLAILWRPRPPQTEGRTRSSRETPSDTRARWKV